MNANHGPTVSIVIPVYSRADTIARAITSAKDQTFQNHEIIVVDDGSTDDTVATVEALAVEQLRIIRHDANRGAAAARNSGVAAARGRWIAFLDSDDAWEQQKLERQVAMMEAAEPTVRACVTGFRLFRGNQSSTVLNDYTSADFHRQILFGCSISPGSTLMAERGVFAEIGPFDEQMRRLEDWDWLLRFARRHDLAFVPEPLATIYEGPRPAGMRKRDVVVLDALERIRAKHLAHLALLDRQRLRSSLLIERAAITWRSGWTWNAIGLSLGAVLVYPFRNIAFFRMLGRSLLAAFRRQ
jgi:glycosyltransferase involved in cell wall biosynthesis